MKLTRLFLSYATSLLFFNNLVYSESIHHRTLYCELNGPTCISSGSDSNSGYCGDSLCSVDEDYTLCPQDCSVSASYCGDTICDADMESCSNCDTDCGVCSPVTICGDMSCDVGEDCSSCLDDCGICPPPDPYCGDDRCDSDGWEDCVSCADDCGTCPYESSCGDGTCNIDRGEDCSSCVDDCGQCSPPTPYCGDGNCHPDFGETCNSCEIDCSTCQGTCNWNGYCEPQYFEDVNSCPNDCHVLTCNNDSVCDIDEDCSSCSDCCPCEYVNSHEYTSGAECILNQDGLTAHCQCLYGENFWINRQTFDIECYTQTIQWLLAIPYRESYSSIGICTVCKNNLPTLTNGNCYYSADFKEAYCTCDDGYFYSLNWKTEITLVCDDAEGWDVYGSCILPCGNNICDISEGCSSCPQDCGSCPSASETSSNTPTPTGTDTHSNTPSLTGTCSTSITPSNTPTPTGTNTPTQTPILEIKKNETEQTLSPLDSVTQQSGINSFVSSPQGTGIFSGIGAIVALITIGIGYILYSKLRKPPTQQTTLHKLQPIMTHRTNNPVQVISQSSNNSIKGTYATSLKSYRSPQLTSVSSQISTATLSPRTSPEFKSSTNPRASVINDYSVYKKGNIKATIIRNTEPVELREKISFKATHIRNGK